MAKEWPADDDLGIRLSSKFNMLLAYLDGLEHRLHPLAKRGDGGVDRGAPALLGGHGVALLLEPVALGDVLVGSNPAASRHRPARDADHAAVAELVDAAGDLGGRKRFC